MMKRNVKIWCAVIVVAILVTGGIFVAMILFRMFAGGEKKEEKLKSYKYSSGGSMLGSSYSQSVEEYNEDSAIVTIRHREWHHDDGTVKEYLVDKKILNELKAVFVKYRMKNWEDENFADIFIGDGASRSYRFDFKTNSVSFSSQYYPEEYASKLKKLDEIVDKYLKNATLLPGLVRPDTITEGDQELPYDLNNGKIILSVYSYYQKYLCYRLANGTEEAKGAEFVIRLYRDDESTPIYEKTSEVKAAIYPRSTNESSIKLKERLTPGKYRLEVFGYTTEFEIQ